MVTRSLFSVLLVHFLAAPSLFAQLPTTGKSLTSAVYGYGVGSVKIKPTHIRVSIPLKASEEIAEDATERLRELREEMIDRAAGLGAIEGSVKAVGFQCTRSGSASDPFGRRNEAAVPKYTAQCHFVADFSLADLSDNEAMLAMSSTIVGELSSLVPEQSSNRRNYSYSTLPNGITTQQLDAPLGLFWAKVSAEQRGKAYKMSIDQASEQVDNALAGMGITSHKARVVNQNPNYSSYSVRAKHPVADVLFSSSNDLAISSFPDAVAFQVNLTVTATFDAGLSKSDSK